MYIFIWFQVRINLRDSSAGPITKTINHGKIITPRKTHTVPSATSLNNTSPRIKSLNSDISPDMSWPCRVPWPNTKGPEAMVENARQLCKKRKPSKSPFPNQAPSKNDKSQHLNSEGITTEATSPSEWTTKVPTLNSYGKSQSKT